MPAEMTRSKTSEPLGSGIGNSQSSRGDPKETRRALFMRNPHLPVDRISQAAVENKSWFQPEGEQSRRSLKLLLQAQLRIDWHFPWYALQQNRQVSLHVG